MSRECPECGGQGWLWYGDSNYPYTKGQKRYGHRVQCDACEGTGIERGD